MSVSFRRNAARLDAAIAGCLLVALTIVLRRFVLTADGFDGVHVVVEGWLLVGAFVLGAVPAYALVRYRLVVPLVVTIGLYGLTAIATYAYAPDVRSVPVNAPLLLELYLWVWFAPLAVALLAGGGEYFLGHLLGFRPLEAESGSES